jgi:hypothetical protein
MKDPFIIVSQHLCSLCSVEIISNINTLRWSTGLWFIDHIHISCSFKFVLFKVTKLHTVVGYSVVFQYMYKIYTDQIMVYIWNFIFSCVVVHKICNRLLRTSQLPVW